jgi:F-type H+-transporting ATPase subunit delta
MIDKNIVKNYTNALFSKATNDNIVEIIYKQLCFLNEAFSSDVNLRNSMNYPVLSMNTKTEIITYIAEHFEMEELVKNFLLIVLQNSRLGFLNDIVVLFNKMMLDSKFIKIVDVTSAGKLNKKQQKWVLDYIEEKLKQKTQINFLVNNALIAGITIEYDSICLDYSVNAMIDKIKNSFK